MRLAVAGTDSARSGSDTDAEAGRCRTDELEITASDTTITGDDEGSVAVTFKNGGGHDCTLSGYAGVDLKMRVSDSDRDSLRRMGSCATARTHSGMAESVEAVHGRSVQVLHFLLDFCHDDLSPTWASPAASWSTTPWESWRAATAPDVMESSSGADRVIACGKGVGRTGGVSRSSRWRSGCRTATSRTCSSS